MGITSRVQAIPLTSIASSAVTGNYAAINAGGLPYPCFLIKIFNNSNKDVTVSYDGVNDHDFIPSTENAFVSDFLAQPRNSGASFAAGTIVYVKGTAGTGNIYLVGYYQV